MNSKPNSKLPARKMLPGTLALAGWLAAGGLAWASPGSQPQAAASPAATPKPDLLPTVAEKLVGLERHEGLLTLDFIRGRGKVWLEVPPTSAPDGEVGRYIYVEGLVTGLGSNPVGLDRGQIGPTRVVSLRLVGGRLLVEQQNLGFRALTENAMEQRAVRQSFATSILWGGPVVARDPDGRAMVDFTSFAVRDAHGVAATLKATGQGPFSLDEGRSAADLENCLVFPENIELQALLTVRRKRAWPRGPSHGAELAGVHAGAASFAVEAAAARLQATAFRPAFGQLRHRVRRLCAPAGRATGDTVAGAAPAGEGRSERGALGREEAHRLLRGCRRAGAGAQRSAGRRPLVGARVRRGRIRGCVSCRAAARGGEPAGCALQRHPMGAPGDPGLVLWRWGHRSANG